MELRSDERRELEYTKGQIAFEDQPACPLVLDDLQGDVLRELRQMARERDGISAGVGDEQLLLNRYLAVPRDGVVYLTNAGLLMLAKDPKSLIPGAYVRFLRYEGTEARTGKDQNLIKDQLFEGPIPQIIHRVRDYLKTQLREFSYRGPEAMFVTEPEYPEGAWDEAVVNALVHRSYSFVNTAVSIRMYDDRLEVISPGDYPKGIQPKDFLSNPLSNPRNPHLMEIMRGLRFVKMISEGTKRMITTMTDAGLPPPEFSPPGHHYVTVTLHNNLDQRVDRGIGSTESSSGFANLYALQIVGPEQAGPVPTGEGPPDATVLRSALVNALLAQGYAVDSFTNDLAVDFRREYSVPALRQNRLASLYPAINFRVIEFGSSKYLCLDHTVEVRNRAALDKLVLLLPALEGRRFRRAFYRTGGAWQPCYIQALADGIATVEPRGAPGTRVQRPYHDVLPNLSLALISEVLRADGIDLDLMREVRRLSLASTHGASRERANRTRTIANELREKVFPLTIGDHEVTLAAEPKRLNSAGFRLRRDLDETDPVFTQDGKSVPTVSDGLLRMGSYDKPRRTLQLALLCTTTTLGQMQVLVNAISRGSLKYQGMERTFGLRFAQPTLLVTSTCEEYLGAVQEFHARRPDGDRPFFLVFAPEAMYSRADHGAPYYQVKHYLLEHGYASQMVDEATLADPKFKELNLALDIFAKCGYVPWVLKEGLPGADLFIGLSYSSLPDHDLGRLKRIIAYVNVFDEYGRWQYYRGNSAPIPFDQRTRHFRDLIREVVGDYRTRNTLRRVHIHHDSKLSRSDRFEIAEGVLDVTPDAEVSFVYLNKMTPIRLYDDRAEGDGSLQRGSYVITGPNQFYISTTGANELGQRSLGTPRPIEVTVRRVNGRDDLDLRMYAQHVLSLTKLNWASSRTFSHEPISVKYASDIARLMNVFISSFGSFSLHPDLERTAWFL